LFYYCIAPFLLADGGNPFPYETFIRPLFFFCAQKESFQSQPSYFGAFLADTIWPEVASGEASPLEGVLFLTFRPFSFNPWIFDRPRLG